MADAPIDTDAAHNYIGAVSHYIVFAQLVYFVKHLALDSPSHITWSRGGQRTLHPRRL